ncbi:hypothetical protein UFOVP1604_82 [uncultured Caudovirales phage]|uniref:Uncharacterized protein n=1 Tax=uncultured Caudovirales phage TaxID=2100421 RepID=A0A6J5SUM3_9CAUD|nr:hypothetical protein UFOVP1604_82 [uncultured Caudovirales phage]
MNILNFNDFLLLEARLSKHADKRVEQRIKDSLKDGTVIDFPAAARKKISLTGRSLKDVSNEATQLIKDEFMRRLTNRIERPDFPDGNRVVVLLDPQLKYGHDTFPISISVTSENEVIDKKTGKKSIIKRTYTGERLCVYIADNVMTTVKVLPENYTDIDIEKDSDDHFINKKLEVKTSTVLSGGSEYIIELSKTGEVSPHTGQIYTGHGIVTEKEFALTPGRRIKVIIPFMDKVNLTNVEVISVVNRESARADKFIKVDVVLEDGRKVPKTLRAGDQISLPVGPDGEWQNCQVADSLFVDYANRGGSFSLKYK